MNTHFKHRPVSQRFALIIFLSICLLFTLIIGSFWQWTKTYATPSNTANTVLSTLPNSVSFSTTHDNEWLVFFPTTNKKTQGIILYPGARVTSYAYSQIASTLASEGYPVIIPQMPFNLALFHGNVYQDIITHFPTVKNWVLGGHSLGGASASMQIDPINTSLSSETINGLFFLGAYPTADFSTTNFPMLNIWASNDGLVNEQKRADALSKFSTQTTQVMIDGGNHAQFGLYGPQTDDGIATISAEQQQIIIVEAFLQWLPTLTN